MGVDAHLVEPTCHAEAAQAAADNSDGDSAGYGLTLGSGCSQRAAREDGFRHDAV